MMHLISLVLSICALAILISWGFAFIEWAFEHFGAICLTIAIAAALAYVASIINPYVDWGTVGAWAIFCVFALIMGLGVFGMVEDAVRKLHRLLPQAQAPTPAASTLASIPDPRTSCVTGLRAIHADHGAGIVEGLFGSRLVVRFGDGASERVLPASQLSSYWFGKRVFHAKFGNGTVRHVVGNRLTVDFERAGEKQVIDSFVEEV